MRGTVRRKIGILIGISAVILAGAMMFGGWLTGRVRAEKTFAKVKVEVIERPIFEDMPWWMRLPWRMKVTYEVRLTGERGLMSTCAVPWVPGPVEQFEITMPYPAAEVYAVRFGNEFTLTASFAEGEIQLLKWRLSIIRSEKRDPNATSASARKLGSQKGVMPLSVLSTDPETESFGVFADQAVIIRLLGKVPDSFNELRAGFVKHRKLTPQGTVELEPANGRAVILPGRQAVAFVPSPLFIQGPEKGLKHNYEIDFNPETSGLDGLRPFHMEFSVVDIMDDVGPCPADEKPGYDYIEVLPTYAPNVKWSAPLAPDTVTPQNARMKDVTRDEEVPITVDFDYMDDRLYLHPTKAPRPDTQYEILLGRGFASLGGRHLLEPFKWRYRTRPSQTPVQTLRGPFVQEMEPLPFAADVEPKTLVCATFNEPMNIETLTGDNVHLRAYGSEADVAVKMSYEPEFRRLTLAPLSPLEQSHRYELTLELESIHAAGPEGKAMQGQQKFVFTARR